jgi:hypothetical protein
MGKDIYCSCSRGGHIWCDSDVSFCMCWCDSGNGCACFDHDMDAARTRLRSFGRRKKNVLKVPLCIQRTVPITRAALALLLSHLTGHDVLVSVQNMNRSIRRLNEDHLTPLQIAERHDLIIVRSAGSGRGRKGRRASKSAPLKEGW